MEAFETEEQTAKREIQEEIGISVDFLPGFKESMEYDILGGKRKTVALFLAECVEPLRINNSEIRNCFWLSAQEAKSTLPEWYRPVIEKLERMMRKECQ